MNEQLINHIIELSHEQESNSHGGNKKCFLINDYALLKQKFTTDEIEKTMQITEKLEKKGVNIARTLGFKVLKQNIQYWNADKDVLVSEGYVLQQRAKGTPLLDRTNWNAENQRYQIDYLKQLDSMSKEGQNFFDQFVKDWIEIQEAGMQIDPSKPGNFIYEQGKGITFIDLGLLDQKPDISTSVYEQLAVILNLYAYNNCYPEIQQSAQERLSIIMEKYKNAIVEQGIDINVFNQVIETQIPETISEHSEQAKETPEDEIARLEETINRHIKEEESRKAIFSTTDNSYHSKVKKEDFKRVAENSIKEKSTVFEALKLATQELEKDDNIKSQGEELLW